MDRLGVGLTGTGWVSHVHARALARVARARMVAVTSRDRDRAGAFARGYGIAKTFTDTRAMIEDPEVQVVVVGLPNHLHSTVVLQCAAAGKAVICEKPLARSYAEGARMVRACREAGVMLAVAEELCFVPKFVEAKRLVAAGALGRIYHVHQREQHDGPHTPWFFEPEQAGGGVLMDMGCHCIEVTRFALDYPEPVAVYACAANHLHPDSPLEDHATLLVEFRGGATAVLEPSWALKGGMESHLDLFGTDGALYVDLLKGTGMRMFSATGLPEDPDTLHWSRPDPDWLWNNGYPQEMEHFLECAMEGNAPRVTGEDGLAQLEIIEAAYHSAATGRRVELPFRDSGATRAVDLWMPNR